METRWRKSRNPLAVIGTSCLMENTTEKIKNKKSVATSICRNDRMLPAVGVRNERSNIETKGCKASKRAIVGTCSLMNSTQTMRNFTMRKATKWS